MSEIPPSNEPPPPGQPYAPYYRPGAVSYGSAEKLRALADGYFGLSRVFAVNVVIVIGSRLSTATMKPDQALVTMFGIAAVLFVAVAVMSYGPNKKIGVGKDWPTSNAVLASVLMGLNSALCCGIIGYIVMQGIAAKEMKNYGISGGFFGMNKKAIEAKIQELRNMPSPPTAGPSGFSI